ncbi:MAG TPA: sigma factor-like helix-turn-helix DNA-binding protein, partial [Streptomyces sp.]
MDGLREQDIGGAAGAESPRGARGGAAGADGAAELLAGATGVSAAHEVRLFGAAYRMLGSACEADELVGAALGRVARTAYSRASAADRDAALVADVVGAALAALEPSRQRRDTHTGSWMPEPVLTGTGVLGPLETAEARESVSMARLVVLERLTPAERAAYVLREMFGYGTAESAAVLGVSEVRGRAMHRRARRRVRESAGPRGEETTVQERWALAEELLRATTEADEDALAELLHEDVVSWSDGGGQEGMARRPVLGAVKVGRFLAGLLAKAPEGTH